MTVEQKNVHIRPLGDSALIVDVGKDINKDVHKKVIHLVRLIEKQPFDGLQEVVPSYTNVTVYYDPVIVHFSQITRQMQSPFSVVSDYMKKYIKDLSDNIEIPTNLIELPVYYGGKYGPDLEYVATTNNLTPKEVIEIHSSKEYLVYMLGFAPGFPFLGGVDSRIAIPRREHPRPNTPKGSVGIAGQQTGIYSLETPGGWQIIGRTTVELFLPKQQPPTLLQPGDTIRFIPMSHEEMEIEKELQS